MPTKLKGSGGHVFAELSPDQTKKADLGVGELFLATVGRLDEDKISNYFCKICAAEYDQSPKISIQKPNEKVAEGMFLQEIGQYLCNKCGSKIGEYRIFSKN